MSRRNVSPFSDGSDEDEEYWTQVVKNRREHLNGEDAVRKILAYLKQSVEVLELEKKRYRDAKDTERWQETVKRLEWTEAMIIWVNHNV